MIFFNLKITQFLFLVPIWKFTGQYTWCNKKKEKKLQQMKDLRNIHLIDTLALISGCTFCKLWLWQSWKRGASCLSCNDFSDYRSSSFSGRFLQFLHCIQNKCLKGAYSFPDNSSFSLLLRTVVESSHFCFILKPSAAISTTSPPKS